MALPGTIPTYLPLLPPPHRMPPPPGVNPPGFLLGSPSEAPLRRENVLRIVDHFMAPPFDLSHGEQVERSARQSGYQGPVQRTELTKDPMTEDVTQASFRALGGGELSPEETRAALNRGMVGAQVGLLNGAAQVLNADARAGVSNSVTNLSLGSGPANVAQSVYREARQGWGPAPTPPALNDIPELQEMHRQDRASYERSKQTMTNLANAWGIDPKVLSDPDPAVHGPARQRFQQHLLDAAQASSESPSVQAAQKNYQRAETAYTANNNSVVVSAGNWGSLLDDMRADNGNRELKVDPDFHRNVLVGDNSISVGALDLDPKTGAPRVAPYSNRDSEVDVYAYGTVPGANGTSFAAPRVAAVAQALRLQNPNASQETIRREVLRVFTTQGPDGPPGNQEQSGNVANFLGEVQWPRQNFVIPGPGLGSGPSFPPPQ